MSRLDEWIQELCPDGVEHKTPGELGKFYGVLPENLKMILLMEMQNLLHIKRCISRFAGGKRAEKKQGVIGKLKSFFEKYFGIGGAASFTEEPPLLTDTPSSEPAVMVAEEEASYHTK